MTYEEALALLNEKFGNKDNIIALATLMTDDDKDETILPTVRHVDAYYENGAFYVTSTTTSNKVKQVMRNPDVAITLNHDGIGLSSMGIGKHLGWIMEESNADLRLKLREVFSEWYEHANDESNRDCCILTIRLTKAVINDFAGHKFYHMDFVNKTVVTENKN
jgi:general stress protein 26